MLFITAILSLGLFHPFMHFSSGTIEACIPSELSSKPCFNFVISLVLFPTPIFEYPHHLNSPFHLISLLCLNCSVHNHLHPQSCKTIIFPIHHALQAKYRSWKRISSQLIQVKAYSKVHVRFYVQIQNYNIQELLRLSPQRNIYAF